MPSDRDLPPDDWREDDPDEWRAPAEVARPTRAQEVGWRLRGLAYALAFALPLLMLLGLAFGLRGLADDAGAPPAGEAQAGAASPSPTVIGAWPPGVIFAPNTVPAIIRDELVAPGARHGYLFHGAAGDIWTIEVEPIEANGVDLRATLYGPAGEVVALSEQRAAADPSARIVLRLPQRGDYRLLVEGGAGLYRLSLFAE